MNESKAGGAVELSAVVYIYNCKEFLEVHIFNSLQ